jgi:hypothetical protein
MERFIEEQFLSEVPEQRQHVVKSEKHKGKIIHRYPYWYYSSSWGREMTREPKCFGLGGYKGNFIPQIPIMAVKRFTDIGDTVIDNMSGSGTTLDVCNFLQRHCLAFDLYPHRDDILPIEKLARVDVEASLFVMHPSYADFGIIYGKESYLLEKEEEREFPRGRGLSIPPDDFLIEFGNMIDDEVIPHLVDDGHVCLVIGDGWRGEGIYPLTARTVELFLSRGFDVKHYITKYIGVWTQRLNRAMWEYRALRHGFGVLEHEYIVILQRGDVDT